MISGDCCARANQIAGCKPLCPGRWLAAYDRYDGLKNVFQESKWSFAVHAAPGVAAAGGPEKL